MRSSPRSTISSVTAVQAAVYPILMGEEALELKELVTGEEQPVHQGDREDQPEELASHRASAVGSILGRAAHHATSISRRSISARFSARHSWRSRPPPVVWRVATSSRSPWSS
jgi:hypothetical protein